MRYRQLNLQADKIEMVLASHDLKCRVWGGVVTPRLVRFHLAPQVGTKLSKLANLSEEIALALGSRNCRITRSRGQMEVELAVEEGGRVELLPLCDSLEEIPPCTAVLGLDEEGRAVLLRLPSPDVAHVLICGTTGSGKTALARGMITSLALRNRVREVQMVLIDPKGRGYGLFSGLPHLLCRPVREMEETVAALKRLVKEMERRDREGRDRPRVVVFIDELAEMMMVGGKVVEQLVTRLLQRGREAGIHLVACTQKPVVSVIGSLVKSNFPVRVVGKVVSAEDSRMAGGLRGLGAEQLRGRGEFLVVAGGEVVRLQGAWIGEAEIVRVVAELTGQRQALRLVK